MKLPPFLLLAFSLCSAQQQKQTETIYDTVIVRQTVIDTVHRVISDSVTIEALNKSQNFYSNSFNNILWLVGIIITIGCAIFGGLGTWNWWQAKKYNEETKNQLEKFKNEFKKDLDNQKEFLYSFFKEFASLLVGLADDAFENAKEFFENTNNNNVKSHFIYLGGYFAITADYELELDNIDLEFIERFITYIGSYINTPSTLFLSTFKRFMNYCEKIEDKRYFEKAKEAMSKLSEKNLI